MKSIFAPIGWALGAFLKAVGRSIDLLTGTVYSLWVWIANRRRRLFLSQLPDYVVFTLDQPLEERAASRPWWMGLIPGRQAALTLESLSADLHRVAADPALRGIVLIVRGSTLSLSHAQSLAALLKRFRQWEQETSHEPSKRICVHLDTIDNATYVAASAADIIAVSPLVSWNVLGLQFTPLYLKETLARLGIEFDVVKIAPWKTAADSVTLDALSDAARRQYNWLLDSLFGDIVGAIAAGRNLSEETVRNLIDRAPLRAAMALDAGLIDAVCYEDELETLLASPRSSLRDNPEAEPSTQLKSPVQLKSYEEVKGLLLRRAQRAHKSRIGVITLQGGITMGRSRQLPAPLPLFGNSTIGSASSQQLIRAARDDESLDAVILHVDSGGGSALASDLIWRELTLLNAIKPLIVYMGRTAASGGYYIAAPGRKIIAQSATITGSIGVVIAKAVLGKSYAKIGANPQPIARGANIDLEQSLQPWSAEQRALIEGEIRHVYQEFKERVADGRNLAVDDLDEICNGRVWTGAQALDLGLVDALGDFQIAVDEACRAAELPLDGSVRVVAVTPPKGMLAANARQRAAALLGISNLTDLESALQSLLTRNLRDLARHERVWLFGLDLPEV